MVVEVVDFLTQDLPPSRPSIRLTIFPLALPETCFHVCPIQESLSPCSDESSTLEELSKAPRRHPRTQMVLRGRGSLFTPGKCRQPRSCPAILRESLTLKMSHLDLWPHTAARMATPCPPGLSLPQSRIPPASSRPSSPQTQATSSPAGTSPDLASFLHFLSLRLCLSMTSGLLL